MESFTLISKFYGHGNVAFAAKKNPKGGRGAASCLSQSPQLVPSSWRNIWPCGELSEIMERTFILVCKKKGAFLEVKNDCA